MSDRPRSLFGRIFGGRKTPEVANASSDGAGPDRPADQTVSFGDPPSEIGDAISGDQMTEHG